MVTMAQRIEALRTEAGLARVPASLELGFPKNAFEKFETGRQTPTKEQQEKLASYFGVSLFYLKGESDDPTRQDSWMTAALSGVEEDDEPVRPVCRPAPKAPTPPPAPGGNGAILASLLQNKAFQDTVRAMVLDALRTKEGQDLLAQIVRKELTRQDR